MQTDAVAALANNPIAGLKRALQAIVGADHVRDDDETLRLFSEDIWEAGAHVAALIAAPGSLDELAQVMASASAAGVAIAPRGAGMSYTGGYLPATEHTLSLDMRRMNRVLNINGDDMTVTVEAGAPGTRCTRHWPRKACVRHSGVRFPASTRLSAGACRS